MRGPEQGTLATWLLRIILGVTLALAVIEPLSRGAHPMLPLTEGAKRNLVIGTAIVVIPAASIYLLLALRKLVNRPPVARRSPSQEPSKAARYTAIAMLVFLALQMLAFTAQLGLDIVNTYRTNTAIQHHGARIMAKVLQTYEGDCTKNGCGIYVRYQFTPASPRTHGLEPVQGTGLVGSTREEDSPDLTFAKATGSVPVAYDIDNPHLSALNFSNVIFITDHSLKMRLGLGAILAAYLLIGGMIAWVVIKRRLIAAGNPHSATRI
jgi:hypothetical protein